MENKGEFSSFDELLEELNKIKNTKNIENIEEIIQKAHRIKNTTQDLKKENERLSNRFGLVWKDIPEKVVKYISDTEIVYDKNIYEYVCDRVFADENNLSKVNFFISGVLNEATKKEYEYSFIFNKEKWITYSNKIYKFKEKVKEDYVPYLKKKDNYFAFGNAPKDLIIEGDNYFVLQNLAYTNKKYFDIIYIDPPYNTGKSGFKFNDNIINDENKVKHTYWLSFINKRLLLAKNLLKENGIIIVSIDDNEFSRLKLLMDDIFGEKNFINNFMWLHGKGKKNKQSRTLQQYNLCYAKDITKLNEWSVLSVPDYEFKNPDNDPKGDWYSGSISFDEKRSNINSLNYYTIKSPSGISWTRQWQVAKDEMNSLLRNGDIYFGSAPEYKNVPRKKIRKTDKIKLIPSNIIKNCGSTKTAQGELDRLLGKRLFDYPKPKELIKFFLEMIVNKNAKVLDFFAGSGTTGQAVWELNKEDGGNRQFILCTNNENNICEDVTFERLKRANKKYGYNQSLEYLKLQHASISQIKNADKNKNFEYLKELINLKYNSFKTIIDNDNFYVNENIAVLKEESKMEEFFKNHKEHHNFAFLSSYKTGGYEKFKKLAKEMTDAKEENIILLSDNYIEEIKEIIKEEE